VKRRGQPLIKRALTSEPSWVTTSSCTDILDSCTTILIDNVLFCLNNPQYERAKGNAVEGEGPKISISDDVLTKVLLYGYSITCSQ
jgi:hypothetical protein